MTDGSQSTVSKSEYARHRGCDPKTVTVAIRDGRITLEPDGRIDPAKADVEWGANTDVLRGRPLPRPKPNEERRDASLAYMEVKTRHEEMRAEIRKLELDRKRGDLITREEYERERRLIVDRIRALRNALLDLPDRLAAVLAAESDHHAIRRILDAELRGIFARFADDAEEHVA